MLKKFKVKNYRAFKEELVFDFTAKSYEYNNAIVKNGLVNKGLIYGKNGSGKSNLGYAIFDIIIHLTDLMKESLIKKNGYINLDSGNAVAEFYYEFLFNNNIVKYEYGKRSANQLVFERLYFDDVKIIDVDYNKLDKIYYNKSFTRDINMDFLDNTISVVKYLSGRIKTGEIVLLSKMMNFVNKMLWYRSLSDGNSFLGYKDSSDYLENILSRNNGIKDFEGFLRKNEINMKLEMEKKSDKNLVIANYRNGKINFNNIASTGTKTLYLYFTWNIEALSDISFLFIDEFDAFLHYESADLLIKELNSKNSFQTLLTSHNTYLMNNELTRPDCCFILSNNRIMCLSDCTDKEIREAHNLEKIYRNGGFINE